MRRGTGEIASSAGSVLSGRRFDEQDSKAGTGAYNL